MAESKEHRVNTHPQDRKGAKSRRDYDDGRGTGTTATNSDGTVTSDPNSRIPPAPGDRGGDS